MSDERRQKRREIGHLQSESVWLQKALFALRKVEDAREKLAEVRDAPAEPFVLTVGGREIAVQDLEEALDERAERLIKTVREMRRSL